MGLQPVLISQRASLPRRVLLKRLVNRWTQQANSLFDTGEPVFSNLMIADGKGACPSRGEASQPTAEDGSYRLGWENHLPKSSQAQGCTDRAAFYEDVTIPDGTHFRQGDPFVKTWKLRNEGTCTWDQEYALVFVSGALMGANPQQPLTSRVSPGEQVDLPIELAAPAQGGSRSVTGGCGTNAAKTLGSAAPWEVITPWCSPALDIL